MLALKRKHSSEYLPSGKRFIKYDLNRIISDPPVAAGDFVDDCNWCIAVWIRYKETNREVHWIPIIFLIFFDHVKYQWAYPFQFSSALIANKFSNFLLVVSCPTMPR